MDTGQYELLSSYVLTSGQRHVTELQARATEPGHGRKFRLEKELNFS